MEGDAAKHDFRKPKVWTRALLSLVLVCSAPETQAPDTSCIVARLRSVLAGASGAAQPDNECLAQEERTTESGLVSASKPA